MLSNYFFINGSKDFLPAHISPENSAAVVRAHEQEHVGNEQVNAKNKGQKVLVMDKCCF